MDEITILVDRAMARLGGGHREVVAVSEVVDLLLDIRQAASVVEWAAAESGRVNVGGVS